MNEDHDLWSEVLCTHATAIAEKWGAFIRFALLRNASLSTGM